MMSELSESRKMKEKRMYESYIEVSEYDKDTLDFIMKKRGIPPLIVEIGCGAGTWTKKLL